MKKKPSKKPKKFCDPAICDACMYIGDGDFLCDKHQTIVVSDWEPTEDYVICKKEKTR